MPAAITEKRAERLAYIRYTALAEEKKPMYLVTRYSSDIHTQIGTKLYSAMASARQAARLWMLKDAEKMSIPVSEEDLPERNTIILIGKTQTYTYKIQTIYPDSNIETEL